MKYKFSTSQDLRRNKYKGKYFAFEGIDGCGKSTQVEKIKKYLENLGQEVIVTSEPMQTGAVQEVIRAALFSKVKIPSRAYQNLYSADRAVNHAEIVEPALKAGKTVLTHRSLWSNVPYGILDLGEAYDFSKAASILISSGIITAYHQFLAPDKTFYLKVSASHAAKRLSHMSKKKDIYENEKKLAKISTGYDRIVKEFAPEFVVIDGEQEEEKVTADIIKYVSSSM